MSGHKPAIFLDTESIVSRSLFDHLIPSRLNKLRLNILETIKINQSKEVQHIDAGSKAIQIPYWTQEF